MWAGPGYRAGSCRPCPLPASLRAPHGSPAVSPTRTCPALEPHSGTRTHPRPASSTWPAPSAPGDPAGSPQAPAAIPQIPSTWVKTVIIRGVHSQTAALTSKPGFRRGSRSKAGSCHPIPSAVTSTPCETRLPAQGSSTERPRDEQRALC